MAAFIAAIARLVAATDFLRIRAGVQLAVNDGTATAPLTLELARRLLLLLRFIRHVSLAVRVQRLASHAQQGVAREAEFVGWVVASPGHQFAAAILAG